MPRVARYSFWLSGWTLALAALWRINIWLTVRHYQSCRSALDLAAPSVPLRTDRLIGVVFAAFAPRSGFSGGDAEALSLVLSIAVGTFLVVYLFHEAHAWGTDLRSHLANGRADAAWSIGRGFAFRLVSIAGLIILVVLMARWENLLLAYADAASASGAVRFEDATSLIQFDPGRIGTATWRWLLLIAVVDVVIMQVFRRAEDRWDQLADAVGGLFRRDGVAVQGGVAAPR
jgi:hypothetical protein